MTAAGTDLWPWLALAGLGAFHGLNPGMGWLFAVALGLHRRSRSTVLLSLAPIALGHAAAIAAAVLAVVLLGAVLDQTMISRIAGIALIGWAAWSAAYGHRRRVRIGMRTGLAGLALWSFMMAAAHGAGLMLVPVLIPLCLSGAPGADLVSGASLPIAMAAIGTHTAAMLGIIAAVSILVYEWIGLGFLRRGWLNLDLAWSAMLVVSGVVLLAG